jgi:hypothetical protein
VSQGIENEQALSYSGTVKIALAALLTVDLD